MKYVYYTFLIFSFILSLFPLNRKERTFLILPYLIGLGIIIQVLEDILEKSGQLHTFVFHIYNLLEYPLYAVYFHRLFQSKGIRLLLPITVAIYTVFYAVYFTFFRSFWEESFGAISTVESLFMTLFSLYFFYSLLRSDSYFHLPTYPHFYFNTANLIFFSLSLFSMSFDSFLKRNNPSLADDVLYINRISNILMYFLYCAGFISNIWKHRKSSP